MKKAIIIGLLATVISSCGNKQGKASATQAGTAQSDSLTPALQCAAPDPAPVSDLDPDPVSLYSGIYTFGNTSADEKAPQGEAYFYPYDDSTLLFYVYVNIGAPAYNSGAIDGRITVRNGKATYRTHLDTAENDCVLHFDFRGDTLTVAQGSYNHCDCGFGNRVFLNDTFVRTTPDIPQYFVTIANDTVYFSQLKEKEQEKDKACPRIDSRFINYFPDLTLGKAHERGKQLPQEIINEFLPDLSKPNYYVKEKFYAIGKITGYKDRNLFVLDYENEREDEDTYDNHTDCQRLLLLFDTSGFPIRGANEYNEYRGEEEVHAVIRMASHYHGEGGETDLKSFFNKDTTLTSYMYSSESESSTGYPTPIISKIKCRWKISPAGRKEILEITKSEFSSPFFERSHLAEQKWDTLADTESSRYFPTKESPYALYDDGIESGERISLRFYLEKEPVFSDIFTVFEIVDDDGEVTDRYIVGKNYTPPTDNPAPLKSKRKCPIVIETSDGNILVKPGEKHFSL